MTGYSTRPLAGKLGIRAGSRVLIAGSPSEFDASIALPGVRLLRRGGGPFDVVLLFCPRNAVLVGRFDALARTIAIDGALWACWPKRTSGVVSDLTEKDVRTHGLSVGLVDVKVAAIDQTWSGLKFVRRLADR